MTVVRPKTMKEKDIGDNAPNATRLKERKIVLAKLKDNTSDVKEYHDQILGNCELISSYPIASGAYVGKRKIYL